MVMAQLAADLASRGFGGAPKRRMIEGQSGPVTMSAIDFTAWLKSQLRTSPVDVPQLTIRAKRIASMKTTASNRYHASTRLALQGKFTFAVSTVISLGLIFIPLMQLAKVPLTLGADVLSAVQIFLAVAILVYSVVSGTARYELRSEQLNDCGNQVKRLIRRLELEPILASSKEEELVGKYYEDYAAITADVENHRRVDYTLTILRSPQLFDLTLLGRVMHWVKFLVSAAIPYLTPTLLVAAEVLLITDMFGVTCTFSPYLGPRIPAGL